MLGYNLSGKLGFLVINQSVVDNAGQTGHRGFRTVEFPRSFSSKI